MKILRLVRYDFDNLENRNPQCEEIIGTFTDNGNLTAQGNAAEWFKKQEPVNLYLGWDGRVYPKFKLIEQTSH